MKDMLVTHVDPRSRLISNQSVKIISTNIMVRNITLAFKIVSSQYVEWIP